MTNRIFSILASADRGRSGKSHSAIFLYYVLNLLVVAACGIVAAETGHVRNFSSWAPLIVLGLIVLEWAAGRRERVRAQGARSADLGDATKALRHWAAHVVLPAFSGLKRPKVRPPALFPSQPARIFGAGEQPTTIDRLWARFIIWMRPALVLITALIAVVAWCWIRKPETATHITPAEWLQGLAIGAVEWAVAYNLKSLLGLLKGVTTGWLARLLRVAATSAVVISAIAFASTVFFSGLYVSNAHLFVRFALFGDIWLALCAFYIVGIHYLAWVSPRVQVAASLIVAVSGLSVRGALAAVAVDNASLAILALQVCAVVDLLIVLALSSTRERSVGILLEERELPQFHLSVLGRLGFVFGKQSVFDVLTKYYGGRSPAETEDAARRVLFDLRRAKLLRRRRTKYSVTALGFVFVQRAHMWRSSQLPDWIFTPILDGGRLELQAGLLRKSGVRDFQTWPADLTSVTAQQEEPSAGAEMDAVTSTKRT